MKKKVVKLRLNRETLQELVADELTRIHGGVGHGGCPASAKASGCSTQINTKCAWATGG